LGIGALGSAVTSSAATNKRCRVFNADGTLSFDFASITNDLSSAIVLTPNTLT